jgi:hypothetical protein
VVLTFIHGLKQLPRIKRFIGRFLNEIIRTYENVYDKKGRMTDGKVLDMLINSHHFDKIYIWFMVGECPHMPGNPDRYDYFLRFSSYISLKASDIFSLKGILRGAVEPGTVKR